MADTEETRGQISFGDALGFVPPVIGLLGLCAISRSIYVVADELLRAGTPFAEPGGVDPAILRIKLACEAGIFVVETFLIDLTFKSAVEDRRDVR